jgi:hypothetical protein
MTDLYKSVLILVIARRETIKLLHLVDINVIELGRAV